MKVYFRKDGKIRKFSIVGIAIIIVAIAILVYYDYILN